MNQVLKQTLSLRDRIVEVLREHHEVKHIGELADKLEAAATCPAWAVTECILPAGMMGLMGGEPPEGVEFYLAPGSRLKGLYIRPTEAGDFLAANSKPTSPTRLWKRLSSIIRDKWLISFEIRHIPSVREIPAIRNARRYDLGQLEIHLQHLIDADLHKARMASNNEDLRLWFVAELISEASGRIPLLEVEGLVSRKLAAVAGGEA